MLQYVTVTPQKSKNDITGGGTNQPFSKCLRFFVAPLVHKLWSKDKLKTTKYFQARHKLCMLCNCGQTWHCFATVSRMLQAKTLTALHTVC